MTKRLLFVGAGAIGSYLGGHLARAGHDVTLIDPWAEQVETIRRDGLAVEGPHEPFVARPAAVHLHEAARLPRDFEIVFVAMKAYDTAWATQLAVRHAAPAAAVVSAQNCWPDPIVAGIAGAGRSVGLVMSKIGVALWTPGHVERGVEKGQGAGHDVFRAGEHDGRITPRVEELARMLSVIDGARATDNLWGERWAKLSQNAMSNPLQALSGLGLARGRLQRGRPHADDPPRGGIRARRARARASGPGVRRGAGRAVGRCRSTRDVGGARPDAHPGRRHGAATGARRWRRTSPRAG